MNFPEKAIVAGPRSFVTEAEIEERKRKRQEEWEKTRKPDDPEEAPEEEYDPRTLYERLQENKMKKEAEFEEAHKLKNMIRGLDSDEVTFLENVNRAKQDQEEQLVDEEEKAIAEFKQASAQLTHEDQDKKVPAASKSVWKGVRDKTAGKKTQQAELLKQAVKRKDSDEGEKPATGSDAKRVATGGKMQCIGVLPGIGDYAHSDSSDSEVSDSDSDLEVRGGGFALIPKVKSTH